MTLFTLHTDKTAPEGAAEVLGKVKEKYGFIPNLAACVAEAPNVLSAIMALSSAMDNSSLTAQEQQVVLLTISTLNGCSYCRAVHKALGSMAKVDAETLDAIIGSIPLADKKLNALNSFVIAIFKDRGLVSEEKTQAFLDAGFSKAQVFEVVMGVALKTLTNYCNHLAGAEPNAEFMVMVGN